MRSGYCWLGQRMFKVVDGVPIKWAALSWVVSSFLNVGAALIQASGEYSITLSACAR